MQLGKHIKQLRYEKSLSQEKLAEMVYVSRQTISNWENDKSYPDINSLVLLSQVLDVTIDQLIKEDIEMMEEQINQDDIRKFGYLSNIFAVMMLITIIIHQSVLSTRAAYFCLRQALLLQAPSSSALLTCGVH